MGLHRLILPRPHMGGSLGSTADPSASDIVGSRYRPSPRGACPGGFRDSPHRSGGSALGSQSGSKAGSEDHRHIPHPALVRLESRQRGSRPPLLNSLPVGTGPTSSQQPGTIIPPPLGRHSIPDAPRTPQPHTNPRRDISPRRQHPPVPMSTPCKPAGPRQTQEWSGIPLPGGTPVT